MRTLFACLLFAGTLSAQGTFRIFDSQLNDVTSGTVFASDTNCSQIHLVFTVENIDSITHNVTAGRLVITQPATASNAFIWGLIQYAPNADTSVANEFIAPADSQRFEAFYFPNNNGGTATINYCFWERTDMNNSSCVTVTYQNYLAGITETSVSPVVAINPNPAPTTIKAGWEGIEVVYVNLFASDGSIVDSRAIGDGETFCEFDLASLAGGIYMISCVTADGVVFNSRFVH